MLKLAPMLQRFFPLMLALALFAAACSDGPKPPSDTATSGKIDISVDETYRPIIEEQLKVFDSSFPDAHITPHYKPESECFTDLLENKARLILVTRDIQPNEKEAYASRKIVTRGLPIARDAVAVIVHPESPDSLLGYDQLKGILTGQYARKYTVVFDNQKSSTVRYITDSLIPGQKLGANVFAANGNDSVVEYVSKNSNAIGFIGLPYVADPSDTKTGNFLSKIRVAAVQNDSTQEFYKPYQAYIALRLYPLTRDLYFITRETYPGLASGFASFLCKERGQLIFQHAFLFPLQMNVVIRETSVNPNSP